ncbi:MAG: hypothetical protein ABFC57_08350 [Veillonellales bacterium]
MKWGDKMIRNVNNVGSYYNLLIAQTSASKAADTDTRFSDLLQSQEASGADTNINDAQAQISPTDEKYLCKVPLPDGSELQFPPANAPLAEKKAWIEAMKQMTPEQRIFVKAKFEIPQHPLEDVTIADTINDLKQNIANITSYQKLFNHYKTEMIEKLGNSNNEEGIRECQEMIQAWGLLADTFAQYNIK